MSTENRGSLYRDFRRLLHAIRGRNRGRNEQDGQDEEETSNDSTPLPSLPAQRPRPLTPAALREPPATLGALAVLPPELRRRILISAFGERTLHLDLRLAHPRRADHLTAGFGGHGEHEHGHGSAPLSHAYAPDYDVPKTWRWYSCVCHRLVPPGSYLERSLARGVVPYIYPHHDQCLRGQNVFCDYWPPEFTPPLGKSAGEYARPRGKCTVGVMGWLLTCRRAYAEAIDLLYATNTFFIESAALFDNLFCPGPRTNHLLLPERLARITSLELHWDLLLFGQLPVWPGNRNVPTVDEDRARLAQYLRHLSGPFPNLRTLVISFEDFYCDTRVRPVHALEEVNRVLLRPLADAVARLSLPAQQKHVVVELPRNVFRELNGVWGVDVPGLGLEVEKREKGWGDGMSEWLRYPIMPQPDTSDLALEPSSGKGQEEGESHSSDFYYIKEGAHSDLYWDYQGVPRSLACRPSGGVM